MSYLFRFCKQYNIKIPYLKKLFTDSVLYGKIRLDDDGEKWITINGTPVRVGEDGNLQGEVGAKINATTTNVAKLPISVYQNRLKGVQTTSGITVKNITGHAYQRARERGFSPDNMAGILENATSTYMGSSPNSVIHQLNNNRISIGSDGNIITVIGAGENGTYLE